MNNPNPTHDFILGPVDTDSISFCKKDMGSFSEEEQKFLLDEINSLLPEKIKMAHDGYFDSVLVCKAKNYVLRDFNGKVKIKGSALKATTKCKALQKYIKEVITLLLDNKQDELLNLYHRYIKDIINLQDITVWCSKKTITAKVLSAERTNEQKVLTAIEDLEDKQEGTKIWVYFKEDDSLGLADKWNKDSPDHNKWKLIEQLWKTTDVFNTVIKMDQFIKYHLKTKRKFLDNIG